MRVSLECQGEMTSDRWLVDTYIITDQLGHVLTPCCDGLNPETVPVLVQLLVYRRVFSKYLVPALTDQSGI